MRMRLTSLALFLWLGSSLCLQAASAKVLKVLPHYLDLDGRESLSPSLYERDAYQFFLRNHPDKRSALRFDINWKATRQGREPITLRLEVRSSGQDQGRALVLERPVRPHRFFSVWSSLRLEGDL